MRPGGSAYHVAEADVAQYSGDALTRGIAWLSETLGWSDRERGPFGGIVRPGSRVVVKPNWVMHQNRGPWGMECLVTHPALIKAVVGALRQTAAAEITLGDAPLQSCDFDALMQYGDLREWADGVRAADPRFRGPLDFRRTRSRHSGRALIQAEDQVPLSEFVLVDLGASSLLEPVSSGRNRFRVTRYDPRLMAATHRPGRHRYLVARALLEADVVVNLPKLKTHRKAGMTGALKNLVGINGNKEYLPHHRVGGPGAGGDCYPGRSAVKRTQELVLDLQNMVRSPWLQRVVGLPARAASLISRLLIDEIGVEGAWSGNDTVWRMCLDLNRILLYARPDGTLADEPQRTVVTIMDAVTAGQGDGPLAPEPVGLRRLIGGDNAAAVDLAGTRHLGYSPDHIPIVSQAFEHFRWPIAPLGRSAVRVTREPPGSTPDAVEVYPAGWLDAVDQVGRVRPPQGRSYRPARDHALTSAE